MVGKRLAGINMTQREHLWPDRRRLWRVDMDVHRRFHRLHIRVRLDGRDGINV